MAIKKIDFDESLKFYLKDFSEYERKECHVNTFQKFFDSNIEEVERNAKAYKYSIGLLLNELDDKKICYIHSWVEKDGRVIDVTPFANVFITDKTPLNGSEFEEFKRSVSNAKYLSLKTVSNDTLNKKLQDTFYSSLGTITPGKAMEKLVSTWIDEVQHDKRIQNQIDEFGYVLIDDL